jgi:hypothetical protein
MPKFQKGNPGGPGRGNIKQESQLDIIKRVQKKLLNSTDTKDNYKGAQLAKSITKLEAEASKAATAVDPDVIVLVETIEKVMHVLFEDYGVSGVTGGSVLYALIELIDFEKLIEEIMKDPQKGLHKAVYNRPPDDDEEEE